MAIDQDGISIYQVAVLYPSLTQLNNLQDCKRVSNHGNDSEGPS